MKINCNVCGIECKNKGRGMCASCYQKWRLKDPKKRKKHLDRVRAWEKRNPEKKNESRRKYMKTENYKLSQRKYRKNKVMPSQLIKDFFFHYNANDEWKKEGLEKMSAMYSRTACHLTKREQCKLQERILVEQKRFLND